MTDDLVDDGLRRAVCGAASVAWRCVDGDDVAAAECPPCAAVGGPVRPAVP
jgi:hypothetical protein